MKTALKSGISAYSPEAMEALGSGIVRSLMPRGGVIALYGDLGAGKTTLVRGMAQALGITEITSPSFNYYFLYSSAAASAQEGLRRDCAARPSAQLLHLDAYRLTSPNDYPSLMIDELLTPNTLFIIEWPEKLGAYLPKRALKLGVSIKEPGVHEVKITV